MEQAKQFQMVTALTIKFQNHKELQFDLVKILYFTSGAQKSYVIYTKSWRCLESICSIYPVFSQLYYSVFLSLTHRNTQSPYTTCLRHIQTYKCTHACLPPVLIHTQLIQTHHCVEFIYTYTHALHYSDTHLLVYTNIYICASITLLLSLFLQLTHICIILLCAINPHTPLILLLLCM